MQTQTLGFERGEIEYRFTGGHATAALEIVMLHEGLGSVEMWRDFPDRLGEATGARVLAYSRIGYGRSTPLWSPRSVDYMHDEARVWLPAILDRLEITRPVLFGHSDGASIALLHAAEAQSRAAAVIALAPHVKVENITIENIEKAKTAYERTDLRERLRRYHTDVDSAFWGWNRIWLDPAFRSWNIEAQLPQIHCPVLAIQGEEDEYGTIDQIETIARSAPRARALALAQCRHSPHRDQPAAVIEATSRFIAELAR
jgi:pimeloyl-ACP methyl ester carboxylesterase